METPAPSKPVSKLTLFERGFNIVTITLMAVATFVVAVPLILAVLDAPLGHHCVTADPVNVRLDSVAYQIPALLRPTLIPAEGVEKMRVETYYPKGGGRIMYRYCRAADTPSVQMDGIIIGALGIEDFATQDRERYGRLTGSDQAATIAPIAVFAQRRYKRPPPDSSPETTLADGAFRKTDAPNETYELRSVKPLLFGQTVEGTCYRIGAEPPIHSCKMYGKTADGLTVSFSIRVNQHPIETWPDVISQIENLLSSLREK